MNYYKEYINILICCEITEEVKPLRNSEAQAFCAILTESNVLGH